MKQIFLSGLMTLCLCACQQEPPKPSQNLPSPQSFEKSYVDTHNGYSEAVVITSGNLKTIYISGQIGEGVDLETQMRDALSKMERLLKGAGANMNDVIKMNTYIVDYGPQSLEVFRGVRKELLGDSEMPASTLVGVEALALPEWLIEIEAVAVIEIQ
ncbi:RidA family protein [Robiginitalea sp.]|uniref:RidA family protein n=1 Tax=Robiginitalea sp. TaxID=1902411 RepID=UPI003C7559D2